LAFVYKSVLSPRFLTFVFPLQDLVLALCLDSRSGCLSGQLSLKAVSAMPFTFFKPKMPSLTTPVVSSPVLYPSVTSEFEAANQKFAATFTQSHLPGPPRRKVAVVACMDSRLDVEKVLGLDIGDAHVIRNAGGRAVEALRSILISQQLLGTREIIIMHHVRQPNPSGETEKKKKRGLGHRTRLNRPG
jgi:hypothetical protein